MKRWRREWCWIYRQSGEDRKVVVWRPMGARDSRSKWRVGRGYDQIKNVIFVVRRKVNVLTKIERRRDRNWEVRVSAGLSRWMLKSPVLINSWGVVAANERKELKSSRKQRMVWNKLTRMEDDRYWRLITASLKHQKQYLLWAATDLLQSCKATQRLVDQQKWSRYIHTAGDKQLNYQQN